MANLRQRLKSKWWVFVSLGVLVLSGCGGKSTASRSSGESCGEGGACESNLCYQAECLEPASDDDLDGLTNEVEISLGLDPTSADTDGDGLPDRLEVGDDLTAPLDEDGDGEIDALESFLPGADDDEDCLPDQKDANETQTAPPTLEMANIACCCAPGCDKWGVTIVAVSCEKVDGEMVLTCDPGQVDTDGDHIFDPCDRCPLDGPDDPDLDEVCEADDTCPGLYDPDQADGDGDGIGDLCDPCPVDNPNDSDDDAVCDSVDLCHLIDDVKYSLVDSDGDGAGDLCDPCPNDTLNDPDMDGLCDDVDLCPADADPTNLDIDFDGAGNACDDDDDNDGVLDEEDNCPWMENALEDINGDGVGDVQIDTDSDGLGDVCDPDPGNADYDGDGVLDGQDNCPTVINPDQGDLDEDEIGDACDDCQDVDKDGVCQEDDLCPNVFDPLQLDLDNDGLGWACDPNDNDPDTDGDGVIDGEDNCPEVPNTFQANSDGQDDGGDVCDDTDGDGVLDADDCGLYNASVYEGAEERCDNVDNDCNGTIDEGFEKGPSPDCEEMLCRNVELQCDFDGLGTSCQPSFVQVGTSCNDGNPCTIGGVCDAAGECVAASKCQPDESCGEDGVCVPPPYVECPDVFGCLQGCTGASFETCSAACLAGSSTEAEAEAEALISCLSATGCTGFDASFTNTLSMYTNGQPDTVEVPHHAAFSTETMSLSVWVKPLKNETATILHKGQWDGHHALGIDKWDGFFIAFQTTSGPQIAQVGSQPKYGHWNHVVGTFDGAFVTLYVNGVMLGTSLPLTDTLDNTQVDLHSLFIASAGGDEKFFHGRLDEVSIWNRGLTYEEVVALYNKGAPFDPTLHSATENLVSWWRMGDGDIAPVLTDVVGGHDGTLVDLNDNNFTEDVSSSEVLLCLADNCANQYAACITDEVGTMSCEAVHLCMDGCDGHPGCEEACLQSGTIDAQGASMAIALCMENYCPEGAELSTCAVDQAIHCAGYVVDCRYPDHGDGTCEELDTCLAECPEGGVACVNSCWLDASFSGQKQYVAVEMCNEAMCSDAADEELLLMCHGCEVIGDADQGGVFAYCTEESSWTDAQAHCQSIGGELASVHSEADQAQIASALAESAWLGLNDLEEEGTFVWSDGSAVDYTNWSNNEPNDAGPGEDCVEIRKGNGYLWNDLECAQALEFVCHLPSHNFQWNPCKMFQDICVWGVNCGDCDDGNSCTADSCDVAAETCIHFPVLATTPCDDGDACTFNDGCSEDGVCEGGQEVQCNDSNECTTDSCSPWSGCQYLAAEAGLLCDDGDPQTVGERCDGAGNCAAQPCTPACDFGVPCVAGQCVACTEIDPYEPDDTLSEASAITLGETQVRSLCPKTDVDWVAFTLTEPTAVTVTAYANDPWNGNMELWLYDPQGELITESPPDETQLLDATLVATLEPGEYIIEVDTWAKDGTFIHAYDLTLSACQPQCPEQACGDDGCGGDCGGCEDEDACTVDACDLGVCQYVPITCDDVNDCTVDGCDPESGCTHELSPAGSICEPAGGDIASLCDDDGSCEVPTCESSCEDAVCGPDGCGGVCGICPGGVGGQGCVTGQCDPALPCPESCTPTCDQPCGPDGCGGFCGSCEEEQVCTVGGVCGNLCTHGGADVAGCTSQSFESGSLSGWAVSGLPSVVEQLGLAEPTDGDYMLQLSTGLAACDATHDTATFPTELPAGDYALRFDWRVYSDEFEEFCDSQFQDQLRVTVTVAGQLVAQFERYIQDLCSPEICEDCGAHYVGLEPSDVAFDQQEFGGVFQTPWVEAALPFTLGADSRIDVQFAALDVGDSVYDTVALIDRVSLSACTPDCEGKNCGGDGCGGSCGACSESDACTQHTCMAGVCATTVTDCDDGDVCTVETCAPEDGCHWETIEGCGLNHPCLPSTHPSSNDPDVTACVCELDPACCGWPDGGGVWDSTCIATVQDQCGQACDCADPGADLACESDADCAWCTEVDLCSGGWTCAEGQCANTAPLDCDDGDACTEDTCGPDTGECASVAIVCDDEEPCSIDSCDPETGCVFDLLVCDDGDVCTDDACDPATATCTFVTVPCDDEDACTVDTCDPVDGCAFTPIFCDDSNVCSDNVCVGGACVETLHVDGSACEDGDVCTYAETCTVGVCGDPVPYQSPTCGVACRADWQFPDTVSFSVPPEGALDAFDDSDLLLHGDLAIVAANAGGLHLLDVSDPQEPALLGSADVEVTELLLDPSTPERLYVVAFTQSAHHLCSVDITDPTSPGPLQVLHEVRGPKGAVAVVGGSAYIGLQGELLRLDVSDPDSLGAPEVFSPTACQPPDAEPGVDIHDLTVVGDRLLLAGCGLWVYELSNGVPLEYGFHEAPAGRTYTDVVTVGSTAWVVETPRVAPAAMVEEPFVDLTGDEAVGLTSAWPKGQITDGLAWTGIASRGGALKKATTWDSMATFDGTDYGDATVWFSFMAKKTVNQDRLLFFGEGSSNTGLGVDFRQSGVRADISGARGGEVLFTSADTHFIVGRMTLSTTGSEAVTIWVDPTDYVDEAALDASALGSSALTASGTLVVSTDSTIFPRMKGNQTVFDEIRLGTSLASVVPGTERFVRFDLTETTAPAVVQGAFPGLFDSTSPPEGAFDVLPTRLQAFSDKVMATGTLRCLDWTCLDLDGADWFGLYDAADPADVTLLVNSFDIPPEHAITSPQVSGVVGPDFFTFGPIALDHVHLQVRHLGCAEVCDDLEDNDLDGVADCEDTDCLGIGACPECLIADHCPLGEDPCLFPECVQGVCGLYQGEDDADQDEFTCAQGDCDDNNAMVFPNASENCDGVDNDCNGETDEGLGTITCGIGGCQVTIDVCVDGQLESCVPLEPSEELCDGLDNDCNGEVDDGAAPVLDCEDPCLESGVACVNGQCEGESVVSPICGIDCGANVQVAGAITAAGRGESRAVTAVGDRVYVGTEHGVEIHDATDPSSLRLLGFAPTVGTVQTLAVGPLGDPRGATAYAAMGADGLAVIDVRVPGEARATVTLPAGSGYDVSDVVVGWGAVYVAYGRTGDVGVGKFQAYEEIGGTIDVDATPFVAEGIQSASGGITVRLAHRDDRLYVLHALPNPSGARVQVYDTSDGGTSSPAAPVQLGSWVDATGTREYTDIAVVPGLQAAGPTIVLTDTGAESPAITTLGTDVDWTDDGAPDGGVNTIGYASRIEAVGLTARDMRLFVSDGEELTLYDADAITADWTDPVAPPITGTTLSTGTSHDVAVSGSVAFSAQGAAGLEAFRVADPTRVVASASGAIPAGAVPQALVAAHDTLFASGPDLWRQTWTGLEAGGLATTLGSGTDPAVLGVSGDVVVSSTSGGLLVTSPEGTYGGAGAGAHRGVDLVMAGDRYLVAEGEHGDGGLLIMPLPGTEGFSANSLSPTSTLGFGGDWRAYRVATDGRHAYVAVAGTAEVVEPGGVVTVDKIGLRVVDITDPHAPVVVGSVNAEGSASNPHDLVVAGQYAYLIHVDISPIGPTVYDISNPLDPVETDAALGLDSSASVAVMGGHVYGNAYLSAVGHTGLAGNAQGLGNSAFVVDGVSTVTSTFTRTQTGFVSVDQSAGTIDAYTFAPCGAGHACQVESLGVLAPEFGETYALAVDGDVAVALERRPSGDYGFLVLDLSELSSPQLVHRSGDWANVIRDVAIADGVAWLALGSFGLQAYDLSVPSAPVSIGEYIDTEVWAIAIEDATLAAATDTSLVVLDISDPNDIVLTDEFLGAMPPGAPLQVAMGNGWIYGLTDEQTDGTAWHPEGDMALGTLLNLTITDVAAYEGRVYWLTCDVEGDGLALHVRQDDAGGFGAQPDPIVLSETCAVPAAEPRGRRLSAFADHVVVLTDLGVQLVEASDPTDALVGEPVPLPSTLVGSAVMIGDTLYATGGAWPIHAVGISCHEVCGSDLDEDLDGFVGCLDPDCFDLVDCNENCLDGVDNDDDGLVDCVDPECAGVFCGAGGCADALWCADEACVTGPHYATIDGGILPGQELLANDLVVNGVVVGASSVADDQVSTVDGASSAIAKAAVIQAEAQETGVEAWPLATERIVNLSAGSTCGTSYLSINKVPLPEADVSTDPGAVFEAVINAISDSTGVVASVAGADLRLLAGDGRNIETGVVTNACAETPLIPAAVTRGAIRLRSNGPITITGSNPEKAGLATGTTPVNDFITVLCDDQDPCTADSCHAATGACVFTQVPGCLDILPPPVPVFSHVVPGSLGSTPTPELHGYTEPNASVKVYTTSFCSGPYVWAEDSPSGAFVATAEPVVLNTETVFYATAIDSAGNVSACSEGIAYLHDGVPPTTPILLGTTPESPSADNLPILHVQAEALSTVQAFLQTACAGAMVGSGEADITGSAAFPVSVPEDALSTLYVLALDAAGNASACTQVPLNYEHQSPPPPAWVPVGLDLEGDCVAGQTDCAFTVDDDAEALDALQRIYQGAALYYRTPHLDQAGAVLPHQFPATQGVTPIEGTCCSLGGLPGPDANANDLCDWAPWGWSTPTWASLGFNIHGEVYGGGCGTGHGGEACNDTEHAYVYDFTSGGTQGGATFTATATTHVDCNYCQSAEVSVSARVDPDWLADDTVFGQAVCSDGCELLAPESLQVSVPTDCQGGMITGAIALTPAQQSGFLPDVGAQSVHPWYDELTTAMDAIVQGALDAFEDSIPGSCSFPSSVSVTPLEGTCCSTAGLPGPDVDGNDLCDADPTLWQSATWSSLDFQPDGEHGFVYRFESSGSGADASFTVTAHADLDCDGIQSTFQRIGVAPHPFGLEPGTCTPAGGSEQWSEVVPGAMYQEWLSE